MARNLSRFRHWAKGLAEALWPPAKVEITVQTDRVLIIQRQRPRRGWCPECGREVEMVGVSEAMAITGGVHPQLGAPPDSQGWHIGEGSEGTQLICLESVLRPR